MVNHYARGNNELDLVGEDSGVFDGNNCMRFEQRAEPVVGRDT